MLRKNFDFPRNSRPTVPMYADGRELLVFRTFLQSVSVSKRVFRHADPTRTGSARVGFLSIIGFQLLVVEIVVAFLGLDTGGVGQAEAHQKRDVLGRGV